MPDIPSSLVVYKIDGPSSYGHCSLTWPGACAEFIEVMMRNPKGRELEPGDNEAIWVHL